MRRRDFITLMGGATTVWPMVALAQQRERKRRIGVLESLEESDPEQRLLTAAFVGGLQKVGWTAGANMMIDYRWGGGDSDRIRLYAAELAGMQPDVILGVGPLPLLALKRATRVIPIVFTNVYDRSAAGSSLA
jgi:putative ABC transport system substrate-binding protein